MEQNFIGETKIFSGPNEGKKSGASRGQSRDAPDFAGMVDSVCLLSTL
jgi:hypothetical protein